VFRGNDDLASEVDVLVLPESIGLSWLEGQE